MFRSATRLGDHAGPRQHPPILVTGNGDGLERARSAALGPLMAELADPCCGE